MSSAFVGVGVRGEQFLQSALLAGLATQFNQHVECVIHGVRIHTVLDAELEGSLVGLGLLTARVGVAGQFLTKVAKEAGREGTCRGVDCCNAITGSHDEIGGTISIADILINKVTQLMADDGEHFVVVHGIHQAGVNTHAAVTTGKGIDRVGLVDLVVEVQIADVVETCHDAVEALGVIVVGGQNCILSVGFHHVLTAQLLDLCIANGQGLDGGSTRIYGCVLVHNLQSATAGQGYDHCTK